MKHVWKGVLVISLATGLASCSVERLHRVRQANQKYPFEQLTFKDIIRKYVEKPTADPGIEGVYSVSLVVTKRSKPFLSSVERERVTERKENFSTVAIIRDRQADREYVEIPLDKDFLPTYSVRGEFSYAGEGQLLIYKRLESRGRFTSFTVAFDGAKDVLEGQRTERSGNAVYTYKLTYLKLYPRAAQGASLITGPASPR